MAEALQRLLAHPGVDRLAGLLARLPPAPGSVAILTYHRLDLGPGRLYPGLATSTPERFAAQVDVLCQRGTPISVEQLRDACAGAPLPRRAVLVTFDDGYRDFAEVAWPILRDRGVPVVLFVPTAYPGAPERHFWWDRLYAALLGAEPGQLAAAGLPADVPAAFRMLRERVKAAPHDDAMALVEQLVAEWAGVPDAPEGAAPAPVSTWAELAALAAEGVTVAPHSRTHPLLERLPPARLADEVAGSLADLRARLGDVAPIFAYPSGSHDAAVRAAVVEAGYEVALTTERGVARPGLDDPLRLPRLNVGRRSTPAVVGAQAAVLAHRPLARPRSPERRTTHV